MLLLRGHWGYKLLLPLWISRWHYIYRKYLCLWSSIPTLTWLYTVALWPVLLKTSEKQSLLMEPLIHHQPCSSPLPLSLPPSLPHSMATQSFGSCLPSYSRHTCIHRSACLVSLFKWRVQISMLRSVCLLSFSFSLKAQTLCYFTL